MDLGGLKAQVARAKGHILGNSGRKELALGVLHDITHLPAKPATLFLVARGLAANKNATRVGLFQAAEQAQRRRLARAGLANQGAGRPLRHIEAHVIQGGFCGGIGEGHVLEGTGGGGVGRDRGRGRGRHARRRVLLAAFDHRDGLREPHLKRQLKPQLFDDLGVLLAKDLVGRAVKRNLSAAHDHDSAGEKGLVHEVCHVNQGDAGGLQATHHAQDGLAAAHVE